MLILAGISIGMLAGDNSILQKATDAKTRTERQSVVEQARTDVLGYQAENKGRDLEKSQLKAVLNTYFKDVPDLANMEDSEILGTKLYTLSKYGNHNIEVKEIFDGTFSASNQLLDVTKDRWNLNITNFLNESGRFYNDGYFYFDGLTEPQGSWILNGKALSVTAWGMTITISWDGEKFVGEVPYEEGVTLTVTLSKIKSFKFKIDDVEYLADEGSKWKNWVITVDAKKNGYKFGNWNDGSGIDNVIKNSSDDIVLDTHGSYVGIDEEIQTGGTYICGTPMEY